MIKLGAWVLGRTVHQLKLSCSVKENQFYLKPDAKRKELRIERNLPLKERQ